MNKIASGVARPEVLAAALQTTYIVLKSATHGCFSRPTCSAPRNFRYMASDYEYHLTEGCLCAAAFPIIQRVTSPAAAKSVDSQGIDATSSSELCRLHEHYT
jgi:hypothetical protein